MRTTTNPIQARKFYLFLRKTLGVYLKRSFRIKIQKENVFEPPYVLIANHTTSFDPFNIAAFINHPVNYVTSDAFFRNPFLRFLLNRVGSVPKTKFLSDMVTAKALVNVKRKGGIIGIFPEGARSWDGHVLPIVYSTAKLIKMLKIDVVTAKISNAAFAMPRWSRHRRKGIIYISFEKTLDAGSIARMDTDEVYREISASLYYDDYDFQRKHMHEYPGRKLAERLERFLFFCPSCRGFNTMRSKNDHFTCHNCGYDVIYNKYGFFEGKDVIFDSTREWNLFQQEELVKMTGSDFSIEAKNVIMFTGSREFIRLRKIKIGKMYISNDSFYFINLQKQIFTFDIDKITGLNVQSDHKLEFYIDKVFYRMNFLESDMCAYAVKKILAEIKNNTGGNDG